MYRRFYGELKMTGPTFSSERPPFDSKSKRAASYRPQRSVFAARLRTVRASAVTDFPCLDCCDGSFLRGMKETVSTTWPEPSTTGFTRLEVTSVFSRAKSATTYSADCSASPARADSGRDAPTRLSNGSPEEIAIGTTTIMALPDLHEWR